METIESIRQWHEETFPDATFEGQTNKFSEEVQEYIDAMGTEKELTELADMFIVACGISRFSSNNALFELVDSRIKDKEEFQKVVDEKMKINRERKWDKGNGEYKHIGEDNG